MRFEKGHKEATRRRIIEVASRRFRRDGGSATGLAGIMAEAGLTNGAFYPHFDSKEALFREALAAALAGQEARLEEAGDAANDIAGAIRHYLNLSHLQGSDEGCPSAALLPEIGREGARRARSTKQASLPMSASWPRACPTPARRHPSSGPQRSLRSWWGRFSSRGRCTARPWHERSSMAALRQRSGWRRRRKRWPRRSPEPDGDSVRRIIPFRRERRPDKALIFGQGGDRGAIVIVENDTECAKFVHSSPDHRQGEVANADRSRQPIVA